jgi:cyclin-dependent kinase
MSTAGKFSKIEKLGEGTYGVVYKAREKSSNVVFALKRMNIPNEEEGVPATTIREIALQKQLSHQNIIRLHDVLFQAPKLTLVFEYCTYDLKKYMDEKKSNLSAEDIQTFLQQLLLGLEYMHERSVVHRDLKPQNLMVTDDRILKIGDFGLARVEGIAVKKYSHDAVTLWYRSPDAILGSTLYGLPIDIWSVGCIFAEMAVGRPVFNGRSDHEQMLKMFELLGKPSDADWPSRATYPLSRTMFAEHPQLDRDARPTLDEYARTKGMDAKIGADGMDLLKKLLIFEPCKRPTATQCLAHPYFGNSRKSSPAGPDSATVSPAD